MKGLGSNSKTFLLYLWVTLILTNLLSGCSDTPEITNLSNKNTSVNTEFMLSFDDGPVPGATENVLKMLSQLKATDGTPVRAIFFLVADSPEGFWARRTTYAPYEIWTDKGRVVKYPHLVKRILGDGHSVGNHTAHHSWFKWSWLNTPEVVVSEINEWENILLQTTGTPGSHLFRPPYGFVTKAISQAANQLNYQIVLGESVGDASPNASVKTVKKKAEGILMEWNKPEPCVLIFHDIRTITSEHLVKIVEHLQQRGFLLVHFDPERLSPPAVF